MLIKLNKLIDKVKKVYDEYEFVVVYYSIYNFCIIELSLFYFDFVKDIVYIEYVDYLDRCSMQIVFYEMFFVLVKFLVFIFFYMVDELWFYLIFVEEQSVQLIDMLEIIMVLNSEVIEDKFDCFMVFCDDVLKVLEIVWNEKIIGKLLEVNLKLYLNKEN